MSNAWTPGPWETADGASIGSDVIAPSQPRVRRNVARCGGPNREANARLIAAAPCLLEENEADLQAWEQLLEAGTVPSGIARLRIACLRAAIAKAKGDRT